MEDQTVIRKKSEPDSQQHSDKKESNDAQQIEDFEILMQKEQQEIELEIAEQKRFLEEEIRMKKKLKEEEELQQQSLQNEQPPPIMEIKEDQKSSFPTNKESLSRKGSQKEEKNRERKSKHRSSSKPILKEDSLSQPQIQRPSPPKEENIPPQEKIIYNNPIQEVPSENNEPSSSSPPRKRSNSKSAPNPPIVEVEQCSQPLQHRKSSKGESARPAMAAQNAKKITKLDFLNAVPQEKEQHEEQEKEVEKQRKAQEEEEEVNVLTTATVNDDATDMADLNLDTSADLVTELAIDEDNIEEEQEKMKFEEEDNEKLSSPVQIFSEKPKKSSVLSSPEENENEILVPSNKNPKMEKEQGAAKKRQTSTSKAHHHHNLPTPAPQSPKKEKSAKKQKEIFATPLETEKNEEKEKEKDSPVASSKKNEDNEILNLKLSLARSDIRALTKKLKETRDLLQNLKQENIEIEKKLKNKNEDFQKIYAKATSYKEKLSNSEKALANERTKFQSTLALIKKEFNNQLQRKIREAVEQSGNTSSLENIKDEENSAPNVIQEEILKQKDLQISEMKQKISKMTNQVKNLKEQIEKLQEEKQKMDDQFEKQLLQIETLMNHQKNMKIFQKRRERTPSVPATPNEPASNMMTPNPLLQQQQQTPEFDLDDDGSSEKKATTISLQQKIDKLEKKYFDQFSMIQKHLEEIRDQKNTNSNAEASKKDDINAILEKISNEQQKQLKKLLLLTKSSEVDDLKAENSKLSSDLLEKRKTLKKLLTSNLILKTQNNESKTEIEDLKKTKKSQSEKIAQLEEQNKKAIQEAQNMKTQYDMKIGLLKVDFETKLVDVQKELLEGFEAQRVETQQYWLSQSQKFLAQAAQSQQKPSSSDQQQQQQQQNQTKEFPVHTATSNPGSANPSPATITSNISAIPKDIIQDKHPLHRSGSLPPGTRTVHSSSSGSLKPKDQVLNIFELDGESEDNNKNRKDTEDELIDEIETITQN